MVEAFHSLPSRVWVETKGLLSGRAIHHRPRRLWCQPAAFNQCGNRRTQCFLFAKPVRRILEEPLTVEDLAGFDTLGQPTARTGLINLKKKTAPIGVPPR